MDPIFSQQINMPQSPMGGMFGGGDSKWKQAALAAVAGFMARRSPGVANNIINGMQSAQDMKQRWLLAEQQRQQSLQDQISLYDYKAAHPEAQTPGSMDALRAEYLDPNTSPQRKAQLEPLVLQPQLQMVPGVGLVSIPRGPSAQPAPPSAPVGNLRPYNAGGPSQNGSGGFPY